MNGRVRIQTIIDLVIMPYTVTNTKKYHGEEVPHGIFSRTLYRSIVICSPVKG